jgi:hypothetical protein
VEVPFQAGEIQEAAFPFQGASAGIQEAVEEASFQAASNRAY